MINLSIERTREETIGVCCEMCGSTDELLDELAAGMAHAILTITDMLPVVDEIHESLARVMASRMIDRVLSEVDLRGEERDGPAEA